MTKVKDEKILKNSSTDFSQLWEDIKNFRTNFNWKDFLTGFFMGFSPSVVDVASDFDFAETPTSKEIYGKEGKLFNGLLNGPLISNAVYAFIILPGLSFLGPFIWNRLASYYSKGLIYPQLGKIVGIIGAVLAFLVVLCIVVSTILWGTCTYLAYPVACFIVGAKILGVFIHSDEMKKFSVKVSAAEGLSESTFQLLLYIFVWLVKGDFHWGMISSIVMVGKAAAENLLMKGEENKANSLVNILKIVPVMTLTALFQIGTIGIGLSWVGILKGEC